MTRNSDGVLVNLSQLKRVAKKDEKQGEQKPADKVEPKFQKGDWVVISTARGDRIVQIASVEYLKDGHPSYITTEARWFGKGTKARLLTDKDVETITLPESKIIVNQKPAWSDEDELYLTYAILAAKKEWGADSCTANWLKSLRPQNRWKPSDEQIDALDFAADCIVPAEFYDKIEVLKELLEQLKKLKE